MSRHRREWMSRNPVPAGAIMGAAAGFMVALVMLDAPGFATDGAAAHWIVYWIDFPAANWLHDVTPWGWAPEERPAFQLAATTLNGGVWGAALVAVARGFVHSAHFRRTVAACAMITLPLAALQWAVKLPGPMGGAWVQEAVLTAHRPGIFLLERVGLCCGYFNSTVIRDWGGHEGYRPDAFAVFLLAASNLVMFVLLAYAGPTLSRRITSWQNRRKAANAFRAPG